MLYTVKERRWSNESLYRTQINKRRETGFVLFIRLGIERQQMNIREWDIHWGNWKQYLKQKGLRRLRVVLKPLLKGKIADLGCGVTDLYTEGDDVTGVDISPACIEIMKKAYPFGTWVVGDVRAATPLPSATFDTVVCSHVLEHFYEQQSSIEEMKRIVKPDGNIIIAVPTRSIGPDHIHSKWHAGNITERITCHLKDAVFEKLDRESWVIQGKKTATAAVVTVAWSPDARRLRYMREGIRSLREYTKYPYTWVVVDNGPTEQTELVKASQPDVHVLNKVNQRPPVGRNMGAGCTTTDYIAFVDNDVQFYEDWLADSIGVLEAYPNRKLIIAPNNCKVLRKNKTGELDGYCLSSFGASTCWVMRRRTFEEVGRWDEADAVEDYDYSIRAVMLGYSFLYWDDKPVVKHLGLHHRTFQVDQRFVEGRWLPDAKDARGLETVKRLLLGRYAVQFGTKIFVETGTYKGDTVKSMLMTRSFKELWSVDVNPVRVAHSAKRFRSFPYIHCEQGNSAQWLPTILNDIHEPALFWLDAHSSCKEAKGGEDSPVVAELKAIMGHSVKGHVILIDDARYYKGEIKDYPTIDELRSLVPAELTFEVKDDIIRIHRNDNDAQTG